jgi:hypothetical protein
MGKLLLRFLGGGGLLTVIILLADLFSVPLPQNFSSLNLERGQAAQAEAVGEAATATATMTAVPPTATPLPASSATATFTPAPSPTPEGWDQLEPNNSFDEATLITVGSSFTQLTLYPVGDVDFFTLFVKEGQILSFVTFVQPGADTMMRLYSEAKTLLAENDDKSPTDLGSQIVWQAPSDQWVYVEISSAVPGFGGQYALAVALESPTPTPTPTATPVPDPTATAEPTQTLTPAPVAPDQYEPNNSFETATDIIQGSSYRATLPLGDVDYYRFIGRQGLTYRCDTNELQGVDTTMTVYDGERNLIDANDNRAPTDIGSTVQWTAGYTGSYYILIRPVIGQGSYTLSCMAVVPSPPSSGSNGRPAATPTLTPEPTAPAVELGSRFMYQINPSPTPAVETLIRLRVAYDANNNRTADLNEGIQNVSVRALSGGRVVAWALTDERGEATLRVLGEVDRATIPYLGGWEVRLRPGHEVDRVLLVPAVPIPVVIPIATPTPSS